MEVNNGHINMEWGNFHGVPPLEKRDKQLMTTEGRRVSVSWEGASLLAVQCKW